MRPNFSFLLVASNTNLKPEGLLKWKKRLVKGVKFLKPLIEAMTIVKLTSLLPDMPRLSLPKLRLKHGKRYTYLSLPNPTINLYIPSFVLPLTLLPHLPPLLTSPTAPVPGSQFQSCRLLKIPLFCFPAKGLA